jgi:hypothetical protein
MAPDLRDEIIAGTMKLSFAERIVIERERVAIIRLLNSLKE